MRNQNSKVRVTKRKLSKCHEVCRTYTPLQYAYSNILERDESVAEFQCNVLLEGLEIEGKYTTDFIIKKNNGDIAIRECVLRDKLSKPLNIKLLDASHTYWYRRGVLDWGIVIDAETACKSGTSRFTAHQFGSNIGKC